MLAAYKAATMEIFRIRIYANSARAWPALIECPQAPSATSLHRENIEWHA